MGISVGKGEAESSILSRSTINANWLCHKLSFDGDLRSHSGHTGGRDGDHPQEAREMADSDSA